MDSYESVVSNLPGADEHLDYSNVQNPGHLPVGEIYHPVQEQQQPMPQPTQPVIQGGGFVSPPVSPPIINMKSSPLPLKNMAVLYKRVNEAGLRLIG